MAVKPEVSFNWSTLHRENWRSNEVLIILDKQELDEPRYDKMEETKHRLLINNAKKQNNLTIS
jgi:hypothetical protein